jgi:AraC-like DNA-binding protein
MSLPEPFETTEAAPPFAGEVMRRRAHPAIAGSLIRGYEGYIDRRERGFDRHLPIALVPVIIGFGAPMRIRGDGDAGAGEDHTTFVAGMFESPSSAESYGGGMGVQVDFAPIAARRFFGVPMHELANRTVELDEIFGAEARTLVDQLQAAPTWARRFELIDEFIVPRMTEQGESASGVAWAWHQLAASRGRAGIGALAAELGWSRRRLIEQFREHAGLAPKTIARIMRFNHALRVVQAPGTYAWADVAYRAGYYDQAHMIRDFRAFAGATPTEYARTLEIPAGASIAAI